MKTVQVNIQTGAHVEVDLTQAEIDVIENQKEENLAQEKYQNWIDKMNSADAHMPRYLEDIISVIGLDKFPQIVQDRYAEKQTLRQQRP